MAKASIHPNYQLATITCACGAVYETASTRGSFAVEICARCHPFYTGRQKLIDSAGRIERFQKRYQLHPGAAAAAAKPKAKALGYEVRRSKVEGSCYEVYGVKEGKLYELFYSPEDLSLKHTIAK